MTGRVTPKGTRPKANGPAKPKGRDAEKVIIAYPYGSEVSARFHHSLMATLVYDAQTKQRILGCEGFIAVSSGANITNARNEAVVAFLDKTSLADWLLFIDTDMVFAADLVERMVQSADPTDRPILGALAFSLNHDGQMLNARPTIYGFTDDNKVIRWAEYPLDQLIPVGATGTGCLLIHRKVLEKVRADGYNPAYPWFQEMSFGNIPAGEDIAFCVRAGASGFPIHVDTRIKVGHEKTWVIDEDMFLAQKTYRDSLPKPPTFVVIPGRDRHEMTYTLLGQLDGQADRLFLYDNGSTPAYMLDFDDLVREVVDADGWALHRMWNDGLDRAEKAAAAMGAPEWNVAILNNDLEVPADFLAQLATGLRRRDDYMISYPNIHGLDIPPVGVAITTGMGNGQTGRSLSGYAFMVKGEAGLRIDERFEWWYGDDDLERQVQARGGQVVCCPTTVNHLEPNKSTEESPERQAMARRDMDRFFTKWGAS